ncbi:MAG: molybdopterin-guanine dinucleotide biosynthesis protein B [Planctomycetaceae bacterium]|nr:molybdopterin-guanine dinucleotide biosynthesis protein B [Planctomycetaceae bacterium]
MTAIGAVILAGGEAKRMGGRDKATLEMCGETFLHRLAGELRRYDEVFLSVDRPGRLNLPGAIPVVDARPGHGPMGGIASALGACRSDALLAVAVDMPLFTAGLGRYLAAFYDTGCDAVVAMDRTGRLHPLCGIYGTSCLPVLERCLDEGVYRLHDALARLRVRYAPLEHSIYDDTSVANINTPEQFAALRNLSDGPPLFAVSGIKNAGKTTVLRHVIPLLVRQGVRIGVIKHDGHDFIPDVPGTDSAMLREAGAERVAVFSANRFLLTATWRDGGLRDLLPRFQGVDLVLVEGMKGSALQKIEVLGRDDPQPVCEPATLQAVMGDIDPAVTGVRFLRRDDYAGAADVIMKYLNEGGACATDSTGS